VTPQAIASSLKPPRISAAFLIGVFSKVFMSTIKPEVYFVRKCFLNPEFVLSKTRVCDIREMENCIGKVIKNRLKQMKPKRTQGWLAEQCGVSNMAVTKWINKGQITVDNAIQVAKALDVTLHELVGFEDSSDELVRQLLLFFNGMNNDHKDDILAMANLYYSRDNPEDRKADPFQLKTYANKNNVAQVQPKVDTHKSHDLDMGIKKKIGIVDEEHVDEGKSKTSSNRK